MGSRTLEAPVSVQSGRRGEGDQGSAASSPARVAGPPKARRRWGLFAAAVLVVCVGVLGSVWLYSSTSASHQVVAARETIQRGTVLTREDLMTVSIGGDVALQPIPASQMSSLVGKRAALDVAAGSLLTTEAVTAQEVPGDGYSLVGVGVPSATMPGVELVAGDRVRIVVTPRQGQGQLVDGSAGAPVTTSAVVVGVQTDVADASAAAGSTTVLTVQVPTADAASLAALASTGDVAVVLDSRDR